MEYWSIHREGLIGEDVLRGKVAVAGDGMESQGRLGIGTVIGVAAKFVFLVDGVIDARIERLCVVGKELQTVVCTPVHALIFPPERVAGWDWDTGS